MLSQRSIFLILGLWLTALLVGLGLVASSLVASAADQRLYKPGGKVQVDVFCLPDRSDTQLPTSLGYSDLKRALTGSDAVAAAKIVRDKKTRCRMFTVMMGSTARSVLIRRHEVFWIKNTRSCVEVWRVMDDYPGPKTYGFAFLPARNCQPT